MKKIKILLLCFMAFMLVFSNNSYAKVYKNFTVAVTQAHFLMTSNGDGNEIYIHIPRNDPDKYGKYGNCKTCRSSNKKLGEGDDYQCREVDANDITQMVNLFANDKYISWKDPNKNELSLYGALKAAADAEGYTIPTVNSKQDFLNAGIVFEINSDIELICNNTIGAINRTIELYATIRGVNEDLCKVETAVNPSGKATVTGAGTYDKNSNVKVTISGIHNSYEPKDWTYSSDTKTITGISLKDPKGFTVTKDSISFDVVENCKITANLELQYVTLKLIADPSAGGTVKYINQSDTSDQKSGTDISGTFVKGTKVKIEAFKKEGYQFDGWYKTDGTKYTGPNPITMESNVTLKAKFAEIPPDEYTLRLIADPSEGGTVKYINQSNTSDQKSGPDITGTFVKGTKVKIEAFKKEGYQFDSWYKTDGTKYTGPNPITIESDITLTADFNKIPCNLTLLVEPAGAGITWQEGTYYYGDTPGIGTSANNSNMYKFKHWKYTGTNNVLSTSQNATVPEMKNDVSLTAVYEQIKYTLTVKINPEEAGTTYGSDNYNYGDTVEFGIETLTENYTPKSWTYESSNQKIENWTPEEPGKVEMIDNITLTAVCDPPVYYTLTVYSNPKEGGEVFVPGLGKGTYLTKKYLKGTEISGITATANNDWTTLGMKYSDGTNFSGTVTMNQDTTIIANFGRSEYQLTVNVRPEGVATPYGSGNYQSGTKVTVGVKEIDDGWKFIGWEKAKDVKTDSPTSINGEVTMPQNSLTVTAIFEQAPEHVHGNWEYETIPANYRIDHICGSAVLSPEHCPNINSIQGNPMDNLYYIGEKVNLAGNRCKNVKVYTSEAYRNRICKEKIYEAKDGILVEKGICGHIEEDPNSRNRPTNVATYLNMVVKEISGIKLVDDNDSIVKVNDVQQNGEKWRMMDMYVAEWLNVNYSDKLGTSYGKITVRTPGCPNNFSDTFYIPGPRGTIPKNTELTIHICPPSAGTVEVKYQQADNAGNISEKTTTLTNAGGTILVVENGSATIKITENTGFRHNNTTTKNGNIISKEKEYVYVVPTGGDEIYVNFAPNKYTLYVTSTAGGEATITKAPEGLIPVKGVDIYGVHKETVYEVDKGKEFTISCSANDGYVFSGWEYRPFVDSTEGTYNTIINMPASDLTVTAIFTRIPEEKTNPTLYATSNNTDWGEAVIVTELGEVTSLTANPNQEYIVKYIPKTGYYFTNWEYDCVTSPFKTVENTDDTAIVIMPNHDLEVKAMFAPIPSYPTIVEHNVNFIPEPPEGGDVPQDISKIITGSTITIAVTPHKGYKFDRWEFYNSYGGKISPDNYWNESGTGYFIMPDYSVEAVAYFTKTSKITIEIIGEGQVKADDNIIPNGGVVEAEDGDDIVLYGKPDEGWQFKYWITEDGDIISEDPTYIHKVDGDEKIIAVFEHKGPYTLYVSSMFGGDATISSILEKQGNYEYTILPVGPDALGKYVYKIENVYAGDRFELKYEVKEDRYEFGFWDHKPYIELKNEKKIEKTGTVEIEMPASDLTVTAVFKKEEIKLYPKLSITTNNSDWGRAWTTINGQETVHDKKYEVTYGDIYNLEYEAKIEPAPGYYFVNWNYSTIDTPFIDEDIIKMPNMDLEVMAMFCPIPEPGGKLEEDPEEDPDANTGHIIDFIAYPEKGGKVPDDLENIKLGSKVTIGVTVNRGWEFAYWKFETPDGKEISPDVSYDPITGAGSFIMPDYDIKAIAVFKEKEKETYTLYVTHYYGGDAWTYDNDGRKTVTVYNAYVGERYPLEYIVDPAYEFVDWEFRWDKFGDSSNDGSINPLLYKNEGIAIMPRSDMTVTAVFKEKNVTNEPMVRISTNNVLWGDAYIYIDGTPYYYSDLVNDPSKQWLRVEAGKEYDVYYTSKEGFEFTNWSTTDYFPNDYDGKYYKTVFTAPNEKVEIMAFFKPGEDTKDTFTLNVSASPSYGGYVSINDETTSLSGIAASEMVKIKATKNPGYGFLGWYREVDGKLKKIFAEAERTFRMPPYDLDLIARFEFIDSGDDDKVDKFDVVTLTVNKQGNGAGTVKIGDKSIYVGSNSTGYVGEISVQKGNEVSLNAILDNGSIFGGWYNAGGTDKLSENKSYSITLQSNRTITIKLNRETTPDNTDALKLFKIVSVRDLNWKDYFIQNGQLNSDRYFEIPQTNTTMLQNISKYVQPIKMGYAVEFELITSGFKLDNTELVITPSVYEAKDGVKKSDNILNNKNKLKGDFPKDRTKYTKITINKDSKGNGSFTETAIDLGEKVVIGPNNTQIDKNTILWRWVYYLPADTYIPGAERVGNELIVDFDIELVEKNSSGTDKVAFDVVEFSNKVLKSSWEGYTFRYSLEHNLLEDIYDNAQN